MTAASIAHIYRYPVKGLNPEPLDQVELTAGQALPEDRRFAIAHGSTRIDPDSPEWQPKRNFLQLMENERLAALDCQFEAATGFLAIKRQGRQIARAKATEPMGRTILDQFFAAYVGSEVRGRPKLVEAPGISFGDSREPLISVINLASVRDLERVVGNAVDPLRFRANVYIDGADAWAERQWIGHEIAVGFARLKVIDHIGRCAATNVDPKTAQRDLNIPKALVRGFGHDCMGVYAVVVEGGAIAVGDGISRRS
ncbi:MAG: MOSC domain-containing protein [Alphaproteobacteria bacterium]|nr:MOSC domain-containing protein [Alphaproteobacteria bacterium]